MRLYMLFLLSVLLVFSNNINAQDKKEYEIATIAFYNLENLFDTIIDPDPNKILQDEFTPSGKNMWNTERYQHKLENMSSVIADLGANLSKTAPMIVGISEVENKEVIQDLINTPDLKPFGYDIVHYHSPDKRGIDVALIYRKEFVNIQHSKSVRLNYEPIPDFRTRDQLVVEADLQGEPVYVIVNHWPSRRGGEKRSSPLREAAAELCKSIIDSVSQINHDAKVIVMGDFNDDPNNKSIKKVLNTVDKKEKLRKGQLYNPMEKFFKNGNGTGAYNDTWNLFDQLILTPALVQEKNSHLWKYYKANIYKRAKMIQQTGRFKNYPKRTFAGGTWLGGYSDHFPVYLYLIREKQ